MQPEVPFVVRLDGTNDEEGRRLLADADLPGLHVETTMLDAAQRVVELAAATPSRGAMSILVDSDTRLCVSGITGREGTFHALNNKRYGTNVVAGVTPGKGGQDVEGVPVFDTFRKAVDETGANTAMVFVPARFAADSILEAAEAGIRDDRRDHRGHPRARRAARVARISSGSSGVRLIGPNCPGVLSPGKANVGIIPADFFKEGNVGRRVALGHADLPDRQRARPARASATRAIVGIGGDPVPGLELHRRARAVRGRPGDRADRDGGEIGGSAEEEAAEYIAENVTKPVVAYIAGFTAPPGQDDGPRRCDRLRHVRAPRRPRPTRSRPAACASGARRRRCAEICA